MVWAYLAGAASASFAFGFVGGIFGAWAYYRVKDEKAAASTAERDTLDLAAARYHWREISRRSVHIEGGDAITALSWTSLCGLLGEDR